jgi:hypothetical protein
LRRVGEGHVYQSRSLAIARAPDDVRDLFVVLRWRNEFAPGLYLMILRPSLVPKLPLHISTQQHVYENRSAVEPLSPRADSHHCLDSLEYSNISSKPDKTACFCKSSRVMVPCQDRMFTSTCASLASWYRLSSVGRMLQLLIL